MAKVINLTAAALDENVSDIRPWVKVELRDTDEAGADLSGTDRFYVTAQVAVDGDDGSKRKVYVTKQVNSIPGSKLSAADKAHLRRINKILYSAAVKVATDDNV